METCRQCGATMSAEDALCPACGAARADDEPPGAGLASEPGVDPAHVSILDDPDDDRLPEARVEGGEIAGDPDGGRTEGEATKEYSAIGYDPTSRADRAGEVGDGAAGDSGEGDALEPTSVPAGTWASTSESDLPPPSDRPFEREPDTRRVRRVSERVRDDDGERVRTESRPVRARGTGRSSIGPESVARARARGLAVAPAPEDEPEERVEERLDERLGDERPEEREEERREARVVAFPGRAPAASASASSSGLRPSGMVEAVAPAAPPKWLASELLRDPEPAEPYGWTARAIATSGGIAGAAASLVLGHGGPLGGGPDLGMAALFVALAGIAIVPVPFAIRAGGFAVVASIGLSVATWTRIGGIEGEAIGLATLGTTLLSAAQLLRAVQRRSKFARAAMVLGVVVTASWLALDGGLDAMVVHDLSLDAWLGPLVRALLMVVLSLCLLGFLDDSGSSGNRVWPWLVLGWSVLEAAVSVAAVGTEATLATTATPVFSAVAAIGWMQVWATTPGLGAKDPPRARAPGDG